MDWSSDKCATLLSTILISVLIVAAAARHTSGDQKPEQSMPGKNILLDHEAIKQLSQVFQFPNAVLSRYPRAGDRVYQYNSGYSAPNDTVFLPFETTDNQAHGEVPNNIAEASRQLQPGYVRSADDNTYAAHVPAYMINLYNTVADRNGVMRIPNPFQANLIKSFIHKKIHDDTAANEQRLSFNLSSLTGKETLLEAELHVKFTVRFPKLKDIATAPGGGIWETIAKPFSPGHNQPHRHRLIKKITMTLYQMQAVLDIGDDVPLATKTIYVMVQPGGIAQFADVFPVKETVMNWMQSEQKQSAGLRIIIGCSDGSDMEEANPDECQWEKSNDFNDQPSLVLFMDDGRPPADRNPKYRIKNTENQNRFIRSRTNDLAGNYHHNRNESPDDLKVDHADAHKMSILARFRRDAPSSRTKMKPGIVGILKECIKGKGKTKNTKSATPTALSSTMSYKPKRRKSKSRPVIREACKRHDLYVSFENIGWSSWIISPKGFKANYCRGSCRFPIGQESKPSNHATIISIVHNLKFDKNVTAPCCVPDKLYSISLLYFDSEQNVILKQYDDMVAQSCACR
ncbi:growth/differentiation factor 10-like [Paramacrobiotus metropolitanus]|uniref:growth/differentiation factor 10-like n=1 Tax=Paramacrobiotus metropolitanus TaxID=2943436 RepID=UPI002445A8A2|nr:growth/differentiation factor 10-like [Paramacrobiotus metropolitanus]